MAWYGVTYNPKIDPKGLEERYTIHHNGDRIGGTGTDYRDEAERWLKLSKIPEEEIRSMLDSAEAEPGVLFEYEAPPSEWEMAMEKFKVDRK